MAEASHKSEQAFRTIGELAEDLGVPQHILRYWETRFPQLRPLQRAGNRRYYRPSDVALAHRIHRLLNEDGYTIRGVQQVLATGSAGDEAPSAPIRRAEEPSTEPPRTEAPRASQRSVPLDALRALRSQLAEALANSRF